MTYTVQFKVDDATNIGGHLDTEQPWVSGPTFTSADAANAYKTAFQRFTGWRCWARTIEN